MLALAFPIIKWLTTFLPPDVHPMVVHFPIVFLYLTAALDLLAMVLADRDRFLQRASIASLTLACFFSIVTMMLGLVSEQFVHWSPPLAAILQRHQHFAVLTGVSEGAAWLLQVFTRFPAGAGWSLLGRGRGKVTWLSTALVVLATVFVTLTARLGGRMVYDFGAGVLGVTRKAP